jgi:5,10-methylenetetrahydromethanopterin reductase
MPDQGDLGGVTNLTVSCALAPAPATHEHIALAEELGYHNAWCFDSPALYTDVWMVLARAAAATRRIGLGPGVLVPSLRHPMVTASSIAGLCQWAPGRVTVAVGAGLTGRMALGERPMRWSDVRAYVVALRALLRGEEHEWGGSIISMLQGPDFGASRPIDVPVIVAADGPRGMAVATELGDGLMSPSPARLGSSDLGRRCLLTWGSVLQQGETLDTPRVLAATTPGLAVAYHMAYGAGRETIDALPGGHDFRVAADGVASDRRHLALHEGHFVAPNQLDRFPREAYHTLLPKISLTGDPERVRAKLDRFAAMGVTEVAYQPIGPDIEHELRTFAAVALDR